MAKLSHSKDINSSILHNSNQIAEFIKLNSNEFSENNDTESFKIVSLITMVFALSPVKCHPLFGNNMSKTIFPSYFNKILRKYQDQINDGRVKSLLVAVASLTWNLTDSSEQFCQQLVQCDGFKHNIINLLNESDYNESNKQIVDATISIINNIIRRSKFRHIFDEFKIIDRITEIEKSPLIDRSQRIICVVVVYYIVAKEDLKQVALLADDIRDDVIELIDAASNASDFIAEGFTLRELLDIITVICRDKDTKNRAGRNQTLLLAFLRILFKEHFPINVIGAARIVYTNQQFESFRQKYVDKGGESNQIITDEFIRLKDTVPSLY